MDFPTAAITEAAKNFVAASDAPSVPATPSVPSPAPAPTPQVAAVPQTDLAPGATPLPSDGGQAPSTPPAPVDPVELNPTQFYRVKYKVDGREVEETVLGSDVPSRLMNNKKFTQSMQEVRAIERDLVRERQSIADLRRQADEARAVLTDRARLAAHIQQQFPGTTLADAQQMAAQVQAQPGYQPQAQAPAPQPQPQFDQDALASIGDIQSRVQAAQAELGRKLTEFEQSLLERVAQAEAATEGVVHQTLNKLATAHEVSRYDQQVSERIHTLVKAMPALNHIPELEDLVRFRVTQMGPKTPEEMFHFIDVQTRAIYEGLASEFDKQRQAQAAEKAALVSQGVEPPVGATPTFARTSSSRGPDGKFDWNRVKANAAARLNF